MSVTEVVETVTLEVLKAELLTVLESNIVKIEFLKKDGTKRTIFATRHPKLQPEYIKKTDRVKKLPENMISVVDTEINQWRTLTLTSITSAAIESDVRVQK